MNNRDYIESILGDVGAALDTKNPDEARTILENLASCLRYELVKTDNGAAGLLKAMKAVLKSAASHPREDLHKAWIDGRGMQCVVDGFVAIRTRDRLPVDTHADGVQPAGLDLDRVFNQVKLDAGAALLDIDREAFAQWIATQRAAWKKGNEARAKKDRKPFAPVYDFGRQLPKVNAIYLRYMLEAFPDAKLYYDPAKLALSFIRIVGGNGEAIILPIRTPEKKMTGEEKAAALEKLGIDAADLPDKIATWRERLQHAAKSSKDAAASIELIEWQVKHGLETAPHEDGAAIIDTGTFQDIAEQLNERDKFKEAQDNDNARVFEYRAKLDLAEQIA